MSVQPKESSGETYQSCSQPASISPSNAAFQSGWGNTGDCPTEIFYDTSRPTVTSETLSRWSKAAYEPLSNRMSIGTYGSCGKVHKFAISPVNFLNPDQATLREEPGLLMCLETVNADGTIKYSTEVGRVFGDLLWLCDKDEDWISAERVMNVVLDGFVSAENPNGESVLCDLHTCDEDGGVLDDGGAFVTCLVEQSEGDYNVESWLEIGDSRVAIAETTSRDECADILLNM